MISWLSLTIGMFIGFVIGTISAMAVKTKSSDMADFISMVKDNLEKKQRFHASIYVANSEEDDDDDEEDDVSLIPGSESWRNN